MEKIIKTIKSVSKGRIQEGSIGFMTTTEEGKWYNVTGESEMLEELVLNVVAKGNTIEFEYNNGVVVSLRLVEKAPEKDKNWAEDMTNFEDLLSAAHEKYPNRLNIKTEMISVDYDKKRAIFNACVSIEYAEEDANALGKSRTTVFTGHGDAQGISNDKIQPHFIRMAETRAIARALRWATNNAKVAEEETA